MTYEPLPPPPPAGPPPICATTKPKPADTPSPLAWRSSSELVMPSEQHDLRPAPPPAAAAADAADAGITPPPAGAPSDHPTGPLSASPQAFSPPGPPEAAGGARVPRRPLAAYPGRRQPASTPAPSSGPTLAPPTPPAPLQNPSSAPSGPRLADGLLVGVASGVVAGVAWWAVVAFTQRQFVYLSVILGVLVGQGVLIGARRGGIVCGALAAVITLAALAVAQYFIERSLAISQAQVDVPLWSGFSFAKTVVHESINESPLSGVFAVVAAVTAAATAGTPYMRPRL